MVDVPEVVVPKGRWLDLPGRGRTWLTDIPGPTPDAPAVILLHAVGCTGLLTWFPVIEQLSAKYRVVIFDQRWHGRGIMSEHFSIRDCADDVAAVANVLDLVQPIVAGYSMGSIVAQRCWRQHPQRFGGLVLAATTDHFRTTGSERVFHQTMELGMGAFRTLSRSKSINVAAKAATEALLDPTDTHQWALNEWRSTSSWAVAQAVASLGRHHSTPWLHQIDIPTAVVVTTKDKVLSPERQRVIAATIPGATVHTADCGHAGCVLDAKNFVPTFLEAVDTTAGRRASRLKVSAAARA
ncbi:alpha/beta fold hydrolase [Nocardioides marmorisolisilvae]|uniref:Alpha/beta fold hydrolase n=2 Tax=Nocardioides marmorisolisilvae TaxID=1542737 RepID=A0A3N0DXU8_9ACTN|nr:alpha/beta fold hydrolase [Nocardioides marmorisolisilvae]